MFARSELFRSGLEEIYTRDTLEERELGRVVVVAVLDETGLAEVEKNLHLFSEVFVINLTISTEEAARAMKVSPLRKKLRGFVEISMNFAAFIDSVYQINPSLVDTPTDFMEGLSSFLLSLPKFH
jgi:hypothetical protein